MMMRPLALLIPIIVILADQVTKWLAVTYASGAELDVLRVLNIVLVHNHGVSFGIFNQESAHGPLLLTLLELAIAGLFATWLWRADTKAMAVALGAVIGGALGNVIDRVRLGSVVDFIDVHAGNLHWPAFNIADSAICVGIAYVVIDGIFFEPDRKSRIAPHDEIV